MLQCGAPALSLSLSSSEQARITWNQILLRHVVGMEPLRPARDEQSALCVRKRRISKQATFAE